MLILIEGMDGMGKTKLLSQLDYYLSDQTYVVHKVKYPSSVLRKLLGFFIWSDYLSTILLYLDFVLDKWNPIINNSYKNPSYFVLMDRYWLSTLCYQLGMDKPSWVCNFFIWLCSKTLHKPDVIIWLHGSVDVAIDRLRCRKDKPNDLLDEHLERVDRLVNVYTNYCFYMTNMNNCYVVDASKTPIQVLKDALSIITSNAINM